MALRARLLAVVAVFVAAALGAALLAWAPLTGRDPPKAHGRWHVACAKVRDGFKVALPPASATPPAISHGAGQRAPTGVRDAGRVIDVSR